jgi:hypothetical protein
MESDILEAKELVNQIYDDWQAIKEALPVDLPPPEEE